MNINLDQIRLFYEQRTRREQILILVLGLAFIYALFYFVLFRSLDYKETLYLSEIKENTQQAQSISKQINDLNQLAETPLYKEWLQQNQSFHSLQEKYQLLLQSSPSKQWQDVIKTILHAQNNVTLIQIKNLPESIYNPLNLPNSSFKIYQQQLVLVAYSDYFNTLNYIQQLEKVLPNIHWDSLDYQVEQYPIAKVEIEFSILYEKT